MRKLPASVADRNGWAADVEVALSAQDIQTSTEHLCAVLAVAEQESAYIAEPAVPGLPKIARAEIDRRAAAGQHRLADRHRIGGWPPSSDGKKSQRGHRYHGSPACGAE